MMKKNILENIKIPEKGEIFDILNQTGNVKIERIISSGNIPEKIYVQDHDEWVLILKGRAELKVDGENIHLEEMDYLFIKKNIPHKVLNTENGTLWLAIHVFNS